MPRSFLFPMPFILVHSKKDLLHNLILQLQRVYQGEKLNESDGLIYEVTLIKLLENKGFKEIGKQNPEKFFIFVAIQKGRRNKNIFILL